MLAPWAVCGRLLEERCGRTARRLGIETVHSRMPNGSVLHALLLAAVCAFLSPSAAFAAGTTSPTPASPPRASLTAPLPLSTSVAATPAQPLLEAALLAASNAARGSHGLEPLRPDEGLARSARAHAAEMAQLNYFSHSSPVPANATLQARLARHGSPLVAVGENLARLGLPGTAENAASRAIDGWLASPGHRANLLRTEFDRVGFGVATAADGSLMIVQDLGSEGVELLGATIVSSSRTITEVRLDLWSDAATDAVLSFGGEPTPSTRLPAGRSQQVLSTEAQQTVQLLAGVGLGDGRFVVADAGWVDPVTNTFAPDPSTPRQHLRIESASVSRRSEQGVRLSLRYQPLPRGEFALFVDGVHQPDARTAPGVLEIFLPRSRSAVTVGVGLGEPGGSVRVLHRFHLDASMPYANLQAGALPAAR